MLMLPVLYYCESICAYSNTVPKFKYATDSREFQAINAIYCAFYQRRHINARVVNLVGVYRARIFTVNRMATQFTYYVSYSVYNLPSWHVDIAVVMCRIAD